MSAIKLLQFTDKLQFQQFTKTVAASGTPERISSVSRPCVWARIEGKKDRATDNSGVVYIGPQSGNDAQLLAIAAGESITLEAPIEGTFFDLKELYVDVATNGDGVNVTYFEPKAT